MRIVFTGGGTGGHITPIIAVVRELKRLYPSEHIGSLEVYFIGPKGAFEEDVLRAEGVRVHHIIGGKLRRYLSFRNFFDIFKIFAGFVQALWTLYRLMPDIVWAKGGFGSLGVGFVSWLYRIPLIIHESDTVPGLTNRLLSIFSTRIGLSFESAMNYFPKEKAALVGNPIRRTLLKGTRAEAKKEFGLALEKDRPVIVVMGGSQGAQRLNSLIAESLHKLLQKYELIHQCGARNYDDYVAEVKEIYNIDVEKNKYYHVLGYLDERQQAQAYSVVDLFVSRAGAGSVFEIAALGKPSILIPLPHSASGHQAKNAYHFARRGAAVVLQQNNLTSNLLLNEIGHILDNPLLAKQMATRASEIANPDAAVTIASSLIEVAIQKRLIPQIHEQQNK